jgi:alkanesulfonate monooxygenase SsuD/methylene tetrahydromethanopterin reductase-like flavin-dependent oxidoreductase (luciferase family)
MAYLATLASRLGFSAVHVQVPAGENLDPSSIEQLISVSEPAMLVVDDGAHASGIVRTNDLAEIRRVRAELDANEDSRPLIVAVPVSIGRTINEAVARADREARFEGDAHPCVSGIFGDFEDAQLQVLDLARSGCEVLLVDVPDENDVADLLAQIRALVVGATPALFND